MTLTNISDDLMFDYPAYSETITVLKPAALSDTAESDMVLSHKPRTT